MTMGGARRRGDALVHQRAADIVDAPAEELGRHLEAHLDPGDLDMRQGPAKDETRQSVHAALLIERGPGPSADLGVEHRRLLMHEAERDELREPARLRLQPPQVQEVRDAV